MDDGFIAKPLDRRQIDQAYPLVCAIAPGLGVDQWRAFAAALLGTATKGSSAEAPRLPAEAGIITVQNVQGYMHGLFSYKVEPHLRHGRVLSVDNFVVLDLFDLAGIAETLLRAMEVLARRLGCAAIHTTLSDRYIPLDSRRNPIPDCFRTEGHRQETIRFCKDLAVVNDNSPVATGGLREVE
ncbi:hypothetical protein A6A40_10760 [Azospirillum humicireducens]|uniref:GNAT family N-acetyltransferase n=1 Tax=Azospirillum humicireducens TaxID=1226968 RepID=A0A160JH36_9PROT|nr:hypothetical protein A6A40_10760 [Azospirillum humicireducens]